MKRHLGTLARGESTFTADLTRRFYEFFLILATGSLAIQLSGKRRDLKDAIERNDALQRRLERQISVLEETVLRQKGDIVKKEPAVLLKRTWWEWFTLSNGQKKLTPTIPFSSPKDHDDPALLLPKNYMIY